MFILLLLLLLSFSLLLLVLLLLVTIGLHQIGCPFHKRSKIFESDSPKPCFACANALPKWQQRLLIPYGALHRNTHIGNTNRDLGRLQLPALQCQKHRAPLSARSPRSGGNNTNKTASRGGGGGAAATLAASRIDQLQIVAHSSSAGSTLQRRTKLNNPVLDQAATEQLQRALSPLAEREPAS